MCAHGVQCTGCGLMAVGTVIIWRCNAKFSWADACFFGWEASERAANKVLANKFSDLSALPFMNFTTHQTVFLLLLFFVACCRLFCHYFVYCKPTCVVCLALSRFFFINSRTNFTLLPLCNVDIFHLKTAWRKLKSKQKNRDSWRILLILRDLDAVSSELFLEFVSHFNRYRNMFLKIFHSAQAVLQVPILFWCKMQAEELARETQPGKCNSQYNHTRQLE